MNTDAAIDALNEAEKALTQARIAVALARVLLGPEDDGDTEGDVVRVLPVANRDLVKEPTCAPDVMTPGDWVRLPGQQQWRRLVRVEGPMEGFHAHYRVLSFPGYGYGADARIAYPYLTAEQFDRDCEQEAIDQARSVIDDQKAGR